MKTSKKLLIIISDKISNLSQKGELVEGYYNYGEYFGEIHILFVNDEMQLKPDDYSYLVGSANLHFHHLPTSRNEVVFSLLGLGFLTKPYIEEGLGIIENIKPDIIRCYGNRLNAYIGSFAKMKLGIPMVLSMHTNPDDTRAIDKNNILRNVYMKLFKRIEDFSILNADHVFCVYKSIIPYIVRTKVQSYSLLYNAINTANIIVKKNYEYREKFRVVTIGRQIVGKSPINIIKAIACFPDVELTLIGDGMLHDELKQCVKEINIENSVTFIKAIKNDEICRILKDYDLFLATCDYSGIPKAVMEPMFAGMPIIVSEPKHSSVPEYEENQVMLCKDTVEDFYRCISSMKNDQALREAYGKKALEYAEAHWKTEVHIKELTRIYDKLLSETKNE